MTRLLSVPSEEVPAEETRQKSKAFLSAAMVAIAHLVAAPYYLYLSLTSGIPQFNTLAAISFVLSLLFGIGAVLSRRGQPTRGIILVLGILAVSYPLIATLTSGLGLVLGLALMIAGPLMASQVLSRRSGWTMTIVTIVTGLITLLLDVFGSATRPTLPGIFIQLLAVAVVGGLSVALVRQTWGHSLRNKLLVTFIGVTVVATGVLGIIVVVTTTNNLQDALERELTALAVDRATRVGDLFNEQINTLTALSLNETLLQAVETENNSYEGSASAIQAALDRKDTQWRAADEVGNNNDPLVREHLTNNVARELLEYQQTFPVNVEVFITDVYGGLAGTTNRTSDYYQADEGWWQAAYANGEGAVYVGRPEYDESADAVGVNIALPIRSRDTGEITGVLRTTYELSALETILADSIGETGSTDLFVPGENVIHIHDGGFEESVPGLFEQLQDVYGQGMVELVYEGELSVVTQAPVQTLEGNPDIDNLGWVVAFHQHRDEALAPVKTQVRGVIFVLTVVLVLAAAVAYGLSVLLIRPVIRLTATAEEVSAGNLDSRAEVTTSDEVGTLAKAFNAMTSQLQETLGGLEQRVAERTQNLELAAQVGRSVSQVRKLDVMLQDACELIRKEFDLYYVQVYLTDPGQRNLVLEAGTGEVGVQLRTRGHSLQLNTGSINGRAAVEKRTVLISDTAQSASFRPNPLLPDTRGEMAVPLVVADKVVGVLDMQSHQPGALTEEVLPAFEALAGQLAVAIQNANLVAEAEQARAEVEAQARRLVRIGWSEHMDAIHKPEQFGFVFDRDQVTPLDDTEETPLPEEGRAVSAPISLTGEMIGALVVELDEENQNEQASELVEIVARQVAQQLENLRLLESAERYRFEAEQAARRQTREGWQAYMQSRTAEGLGYLYDLKEVRPHSNGKDDPEALTLPLKARDETVGKLSVQGLAPDDKESLELASAVAERLGAHIESLRLFEETKQGQVELDNRARQLEAVAEISTVSSQELDIQKLLETVANLTKERFELYHAHVYLLSETGNILKLAAGAGDAGRQMVAEGWQIPVDHQDSIVARTARTRQSVISNDIIHDKDSEFLSNQLLPDTRSEMAVPLMVGDKIFGVFDVQSDRVNAFTEEDINIQMTLASQVATAMQNARSFAQAQKQAERETMLNTINQKIQAATSVEAVLQIAARELGHALGAPMTIAQLSMKEQN